MYDGKPLADWEKTVEVTESGDTLTTVYRLPDGLTVTLVARRYSVPEQLSPETVHTHGCFFGAWMPYSGTGDGGCAPQPSGGSFGCGSERGGNRPGILDGRVLGIYMETEKL